MNKLQEKYKDAIDFLAVYILEAHANDVWPLGTKICINNHKTMEDRLNVANNFVKEYGMEIPVLVDEMTNNFNAQFASWPERFYIVQNGEMKVIALPTTEFGYNRGEIEDWIRTNSC